MVKPVILFRKDFDSEGEMEVARKYFPVYENRCAIPDNTFVIPRYSFLPYAQEFEHDMQAKNCYLINSYHQHRSVADISTWAMDPLFEGLTPKTWDRLEDIPEHGPFVLKGETNSKKFQFNTHMYAENKKEAIQVYGRLLEDSLISQQKVYIRKFHPLVRLSQGFNGLPISKEFRLFVAYGEVVGQGFYWASHAQDIDVPAADYPADFVKKLINLIGRGINFFVMDIAQEENGNWILIEINDGCMSGPSCVDPEALYSNLAERMSNI